DEGDAEAQGKSEQQKRAVETAGAGRGGENAIDSGRSDAQACQQGIGTACEKALRITGKRRRRVSCRGKRTPIGRLTAGVGTVLERQGIAGQIGLLDG